MISFTPCLARLPRIPSRTLVTCSSMLPPSSAVMPRREVRLVGGVHRTEVLHLDHAQGEDPLVQVLIVPGNPGQAMYYTPFMQSLHAFLGGRASVTAISQLGMAAKQVNPPGKVYTLEEQIEHKAAYLQQQMLGEGRPPVVLLAHSIGTYMCIHAVERLELQLRQQPGSEAGSSEAGLSGTTSLSSADQEHCGVVKIVGLFPFLAVNPQCRRQGMLSQLARMHGLAGWLASLVEKLPQPASRWLVQRFSPDLDEHALDTTVALLNHSNINSGLYLARCEFETLSAPADWWLLRKLGRRFAIFCAPNDTWFPQWKWDQMLEEVPGVEAYWELGMSHGFCVSKKLSHEMADKVARIIHSTVSSPVRAKL